MTLFFQNGETATFRINQKHAVRKTMTEPEFSSQSSGVVISYYKEGERTLVIIIENDSYLCLSRNNRFYVKWIRLITFKLFKIKTFYMA